MKESWRIPPQADAAFVAKMEDLKRHVRPPQPPRPGRPAREDPEYERHGSANLFLWVAPHLGRRQVTVHAQRTALDWAHAVRELVDVHFPDAERLVLVVDNLNIHVPASLYKAFPPQDAWRIWQKLELHYTPPHGSWLNLAEVELSVLTRQCLARRIPDAATLAQAVSAWATARTAEAVRITWRFSVDDARAILSHLYPVPDDAT